VASALARVSLLNYHGEVVYDKFVKPIEPVTGECSLSTYPCLLLVLACHLVAPFM